MLPRKWVLFCAALGLMALASFTTGCGSSSSNAKIRLVNAIPDEGSLDLLIDTKSAATGVGYGAASSYVTVGSGSRHLQVEPSGSTTILIDRTDSISSGNNLTLLSLNFSFTPPTSVLLTDDNSAPTSGNFKLRIVNASPGMGAQDVYVMPFGSGPGGAPTISSLGLGSAGGYSTLAPGDYEVFFTQPGTTNINLDSGKLTFAAGQVRTLLGLNNPQGAFESTLLTDAN